MLVGKPAPLFSCKAVVNNSIQDFSLAALKGEAFVLFFYPLDFSYVCPTELHAFQDSMAEFEKRKTKIIGISVDSVESHLAWLAQPKEQGGVHGITFPLLSDITKSVARSYGVLDEEGGVAFRALFIIDQQGIVQSMQVNNLSLGRNIGEVIRLVDAIQFVESHGEVCPANWSAGKEGLKPTHAGVVDYFHKD